MAYYLAQLIGLCRDCCIVVDETGCGQRGYRRQDDHYANQFDERKTGATGI
jgi:hypothetical protein